MEIVAKAALTVVAEPNAAPQTNLTSVPAQVHVMQPPPKPPLIVAMTSPFAELAYRNLRPKDPLPNSLSVHGKGSEQPSYGKADVSQKVDFKKAISR